MSTLRATDSPLKPGEPERLLAVSPLARHGDGFHGTMTTGSWNADPSGRPSAGSLGVLVDDVLAASIAAHSPSGASVSTEIAIDFLAPVPLDGRVLTCTGSPWEITAAGGLAHGEVVDDTGRRVAVATQRQRFVPARPAGDRAPRDRVREPAAAPAPDRDLMALLHAVLRDVGGTPQLEVGPGRHAANPTGAMHGGLSLCSSEVAGTAALSEDPADLLTTSIRIAHLRPLSTAGPSTFIPEVLHAGRSFRVAQVVGRDHTGRVATVASVCRQTI